MTWVQPNLSKISAAVLYTLTSLCQLGPASADGPTTGYSTIDRIVACLEEGYEAVLLSDRVHCALYRRGVACLEKAYKAALLSRDVQCRLRRRGANTLPRPLKEDVHTICKNKATDLRVLSGNAIKVIAEQQRLHYGIRIVGAIFCDRLDLVGLELPYSLVIDRSIFRWGIDARNFRTHGDLSFDESLILDELRITRSRIDGTIFANNSFINEVEILDSQIGGSLLFRGSVLFEPAIIDTVRISGELSMRRGLFPYFLLQFSKVGSVLDLSFSQARCAYGLRQSEIGEVIAVDFGFDVSTKHDEFDWIQLEYSDRTKQLSLISAARNVLKDDKKNCSYSKIASDYGTFRVSDVQVKSSLCLRQFHWLAAQMSNAQSGYVTFNDVSIAGRASIGLAPIGLAGGPKRKLELVGLQANSFAFDFRSFGDDPYGMSANGLKLEHVYGADDKCEYDPDIAKQQKSESNQGVSGPPPGISVSARASDLGRPRVEEVRYWLDNNSLVTTQPYAAFIDVFQKNGADNDAKTLLSAKASAELCLKARRLFWDCLTRTCSIKAGNVSTADYIPIIGHLAVLFGLALSWIADHGYHSEWVVGWVFVVMVISVLYFWCWLGIIGLKSKEKDTIIPTGPLFLFDRLLPIYQIREDHYHIETFYRCTPKFLIKYANVSQALGVKTMRWYWASIYVVEAGESEKRCAERYLIFLKAVGAVLAIFLLAAINALVSR